jgi:hypothetical protein
MVHKKLSTETWSEFANRLSAKDVSKLSKKHIKAIELMIIQEKLESPLFKTKGVKILLGEK